MASGVVHVLSLPSLTLVHSLSPTTNSRFSPFSSSSSSSSSSILSSALRPPSSAYRPGASGLRHEHRLAHGNSDRNNSNTVDHPPALPSYHSDSIGPVMSIAWHPAQLVCVDSVLQPQPIPQPQSQQQPQSQAVASHALGPSASSVVSSVSAPHPQVPVTAGTGAGIVGRDVLMVGHADCWVHTYTLPRM